MNKTQNSAIAPFFIVRNVQRHWHSIAIPWDLKLPSRAPTNDDIYFGIVQRGGAMIILKEVGIEPVPNYTRDIKKGIAGGMPISMFPIQML